MLTSLRIRNFAIIDEMELSFGPGLNVLTGETGAGKSIITKAIGLLCGGRASAELIRSDCDEAEIEGVFESPAAGPLLSAAGFASADEVAVRRTLQRNGKGRVYLNGSPTTAAVLGQIGGGLLHLYGQHEQALLLDPESHLALLDAYARCDEPLAAMRTAFAAYRDAAERLARLTADRTAIAQRLELLRFQADELAKMAPRAGEEDELRHERERQRHAERLQQICQSCEDALYSGDEGVSVVLGRVAAQLADAARIDPGFSPVLETVQQALAQADDAARELGRLGQKIERDPRRLEEIEERLAEYARLKRKYDCEADALAARAVAIDAELKELEGGGLDLEAVRQDAETRLADAKRAAASLSKLRQSAAAELCRKIAGELDALGMSGTRFEIRFERKGDDARIAANAIAATGGDVLEFYLSANPGEEPRPLAKVASGGELSRILLALKALAAGSGPADTLIFDEVDTGIGGTVAEAVGRRLQRLAAGRQILSITHLPQIAALADSHLAVEKQIRRGRTHSTARTLGGEERVDEIARMLGAAGSHESVSYAKRLIANRDES